jgi:hypothetical protein
MKPTVSKPPAPSRGAAPADPAALHAKVFEAAIEEFGCGPWRLVANGPGRLVYGVGPDLYPDLVALDGSDAGVAWVMEIAAAAAVTDERAWVRWERITATGLPTILAVPFGSGRPVERVAALLGVPLGLVYEYAAGIEGVRFFAPAGRPPAGRPPGSS